MFALFTKVSGEERVGTPLLSPSPSPSLSVHVRSSHKHHRLPSRFFYSKSRQTGAIVEHPSDTLKSLLLSIDTVDLIWTSERGFDNFIPFLVVCRYFGLSEQLP